MIFINLLNGIVNSFAPLLGTVVQLLFRSMVLPTALSPVGDNALLGLLDFLLSRVVYAIGMLL